MGFGETLGRRFALYSLTPFTWISWTAGVMTDTGTWV